MAENKDVSCNWELLERTLFPLLDSEEQEDIKKLAESVKKAIPLFTAFSHLIDSVKPKRDTPVHTHPLKRNHPGDAKKAVICAREKQLDFNAKDIVSVEGKGKAGTRFSDISYLDVFSQEKLDLIASKLSDCPEYTDLLSSMYINRFCCEEKRGDFTWKEVSSDGELVYSKKSKEEVKDILSLYTVNGEDAHVFYMNSPYRLRSDN